MGPFLEPIATGIEYFRSRQMSASTSDDDVPRQDLLTMSLFTQVENLK